jgi:hypothetical protein
MTRKGLECLFFPEAGKVAVDAEPALKHDPLAEYRESPYTAIHDSNPTRLQLTAAMFKQAMMTAALDLPGIKKTQVGRLLYVKGDRVDLYGVPQIMCSVVRMANTNRTPDVRTRAIVSRWACSITVSFATSAIRQQSVVNLLAAAGITAGVGDWRPQKGSGSYGTFEIVGSDHPEFRDVIQYGRETQDAALAYPQPYDDETATLLEWYHKQAQTCGIKVTTAGGSNG